MSISTLYLHISIGMSKDVLADIKCIIFHLITAESRINRNYINSRNTKFQIIYNDKSVNRHDNMT